MTPGTTSAPTRPGLPTVEQVRAIPPSDSKVAPPEWEDGNGHVNVAAYYTFHMAATGGVMAELGWSEDYRERTGRSIFSVEQHIRFYDEVMVGHEVSTHFRLLDRNERFLHGISVLVNRTTDRIANTLEVVEAHVDLETRRTSPFLPQLADSLDLVLTRHRALDWSIPLNRGMGLR